MPAQPALHHACLPVSDLDASERFYADCLGLLKLWRFPVESRQSMDLFGIDHPCTVSVLACTNGRLELLHVPGGPFAPPSPVQHLCLAVDHRDERVADLAAGGYPLRRTRKEGRRIVFVADPDGHWIELKSAEGRSSANADPDAPTASA